MDNEKNEGKELNIAPVYEAFLDQEDKKPKKVGSGIVIGKYKAFYLLVFILPYLLLIYNNFWVNVFLATYAFVITLISIIIIEEFKKEMIYKINPFDFVWHQFTFFVNFILHSSFIFYTLFLINNNFFKGNLLADSNIIDFLYFSVVTITTVGYGDIFPNSIFVKLTVIYELGFGLWFLVTVLPTAISLQTERLFQLSTANEKLNNEIENAIKDKRWKVVVPFGTQKKEDESKN